LPLVVNYDLPQVPTDYVHRVGRTGRAGRPGHAVSLVGAADRALLPAIQRLLPVSLQEIAHEGAHAPSVRMHPAGRGTDRHHPSPAHGRNRRSRRAAVSRTFEGPR